MGHRELCPCCLQHVTKGQLKKHADEVARRQHILAMGGDPAIIDFPLMVKPITGNDIFKPEAPVPAPLVGDDAFCPNVPVDSPPPTSSLPHLIPPHSVEDNDFPPDEMEPDTIKYPCTPPHSSEFSYYPSMETPDANEDDSEEQVQCEANLDEFMDAGFLEQGEYCSLRGFCCVHVYNPMQQPTTSRDSSLQSVVLLRLLFAPS